MLGWEGRAAHCRRARRPTESAAAKPETIPDKRTTFNSRARRERGIFMQTSVRFLSSLFCFVFLIALFLVSSTVAQTQTAKLMGTITAPRGTSIANAQISAEQIPPVGEPFHVFSGADSRFALAL